MRDHLEMTAQLARSFLDPIGLGERANRAGLLHDFGKFTDEFQAYIHGNLNVDGKLRNHVPFGARVASDLGDEGIAAAILGHHKGIRKWTKADAPSAERMESVLERARVAGITSFDAPLPPSRGYKRAIPGDLNLRRTIDTAKSLANEFDARLLFSALVDADRLDAERWSSPWLADDRRDLAGRAASIPEIRVAIDAYADSLTGGSPEVRDLRRQVLEDCRAASTKVPGLFALSAPTGGGKTVSSLSFALRHAEANGLRRVVMVAPFLSIIDQTAGMCERTLTDALGAETTAATLLEHHSGVDDEDDGPDGDDGRNEDRQERRRLRLLRTENWSAPLVITTAVQFFGSLFSDHPSKARKIHNLTRSVIILDEPQTIPANLVVPTLYMLRQMALRGGSTIVFMSATRPSYVRPAGSEVHRNPSLLPPDGITEICRDGLLAPHRVNTTIDPGGPESGRRSLADVVAAVMAERQAMVIVNTTATARDLALLDTNLIHLSARMCVAHRKRALADIERRLHAGEPCHLVATQVVEAGVDLDFPVVFREVAPLDSLIQAAGRCNREGNRSEGRFEVIRIDHVHRPPFGYATRMDCTNQIPGFVAGIADLFSASTVTTYFDAVLDRSRDGGATAWGQINDHRAHLRFQEVAQAYQMIDEAGHSVIVPADGEARDLIRALGAAASQRKIAKLLAQARLRSVSVYQSEFLRGREAGQIRPIDDDERIWVLDAEDRYDPRLGLLPLGGGDTPTII